MGRHVVIHLFFALLCLILFQAASHPSLNFERWADIFQTTTSFLPMLSLWIKSNQTSSNCTYNIKINTDCTSVKKTRDEISLSFGDAEGTQVYAPRIDDQSAHRFQACNSDKFEVYGPCTGDVCYVYLYRKGNSGWKVKSVHISGQDSKSASFEINSEIPNEQWYGANYCSGASFHGSKKPGLSTLIMTVAAVLFSMLAWCLF